MANSLSSSVRGCGATSRLPSRAPSAKPAVACKVSARALALAVSREVAQHSSLLLARAAPLVVVCTSTIRGR